MVQMRQKEALSADDSDPDFVLAAGRGVLAAESSPARPSVDTKRLGARSGERAGIGKGVVLVPGSVRLTVPLTCFVLWACNPSNALAPAPTPATQQVPEGHDGAPVVTSERAVAGVPVREDHQLGDGPTCPESMVRVPAHGPGFCVDVYENVVRGDPGRMDQGARWPDGSTLATSSPVAGAWPSTGISWYQAYAICLNNGKHLCTAAEWRDACDSQLGPEGERQPWGPNAEAMCSVNARQAQQLRFAGSASGCGTAEGVYDLVGNVYEWVDVGERAPDGRPRTGKRGGAYYAGAAEDCDARPFYLHEPFFTGTIGFRCCVAPS